MNNMNFKNINFYKGYSKSFTKVCITGPLFFPLSEYLNNNILGPLVASTIATIIMQPIDYLKTRNIHF